MKASVLVFAVLVSVACTRRDPATSSLDRKRGGGSAHADSRTDRAKAAEPVTEVTRSARVNLAPGLPVRLYADEEALAFKRKLEEVSFPTTHEEVYRQLGLDHTRLERPVGRVGCAHAASSMHQLSESYSIYYDFKMGVPGLAGVRIQKGLVLDADPTPNTGVERASGP